MDPPGILILKSVRIVLETLGIKPELMKFKKEEFNADNLIKALTEYPKKCPAIVTYKVTNGEVTPHIMVATNALSGEEFIRRALCFSCLRKEWFINCKNSFRDDPGEPGIILKYLQPIIFISYIH